MELNTIIFDLEVLTCSFHEEQKLCKMFKELWSASLLWDNKTISSAYKRIFSEVEPMTTGSVLTLFKSFTTSLLKELNK